MKNCRAGLFSMGRLSGLVLLYWLQPALVWAAANDVEPVLPLWSAIPFVGVLLSMAVIPLINSHWWEANLSKVCCWWSMAFIIPFGLYHQDVTFVAYQLLHIYLLEYLPFIILLAGLFTVAGGIVIRGTLIGTPALNTALLAIGASLASVIGTTGAAMLLIRPLLRALVTRTHRAHTVIFFIFLAANIGGSLTPIGDPPLFLGFLHGVPFFWPLALLPLFLTTIGSLLCVYYVLDSYYYRREQAVLSIKPAVAVEHQPIAVSGLINLVFLGGIIAAIVASGVLGQQSGAIGQGSWLQRSLIIPFANGQLELPLFNLGRDGVIIGLTFLSWRYTPLSLRQQNNFSWGPIKEVAVLFAAIFTTIIPVLALLEAHGAALGVTTAAQFFWASGLLSSFLDNAPTYLVFLTLAGSLGAVDGIGTDLGIVAPQILLAISAGSVFMGANTYIGNAPNLMVRLIAEEHGIKMPNFFGYMLWSLLILIPLFILNTWLFF